MATWRRGINGSQVELWAQASVINANLDEGLASRGITSNEAVRDRPMDQQDVAGTPKSSKNGIRFKVRKMCTIKEEIIHAGILQTSHEAIVQERKQLREARAKAVDV